MRLSLRVKILLLIAGTVAGLTGGLLAALAVWTRREIDRSVRHGVEATGGLLDDLMRRRSRNLREQCLLLARQPVLKMVMGTRDPATVADCARENLAPLGADAARVTDDRGLVLAEVVRGGAVVPAAPASDAGLKAARSGKEWNGIVARGGRVFLAVCVPVSDSGYLRGTFTAYSAVDAGIARDLRRTLGSDVAFLAGGEAAGSSLDLPGRLNLRPGAVASLRIGGVTYLAAAAALPDSRPEDGLLFVTFTRYDAAMRTYHRLRLAFLILSGGVLLAALVTAALVARGITRPLDGLVLAAQTLRAGEWPDTFTGGRKDEIGELQAAFNEMTVSLKNSRERLLAMIDSDPLTGLLNHRCFRERLEHESARCATSGEPLCLLLFDVDRFHEYNTARGHAAGDAALKRVAETLEVALPDVAISARYGGEEFAALLPLKFLDEAEEIAERVRTLVEAAEAGRGAALTLSAGCAEFGTHASQAEGLALAAELAVARAKQTGRNRVCRFDSVPGAGEDDPLSMQQFLKDGSLATIQALAAAVDAKDAYTRGHSTRVAGYATRLARYIRLAAGQVELVHTTGTLHDVGKIGVPDAILKKPGRLDPDEQAVMETHPVMGEVIVRKVPQLASTLPGVRHHHERWDGKGYPDSLAGEEIPLIARLLAVADTYDAMTSDRPYRKGLPVSVALAEIEKGAGTQFDPDLARAFVAMMGGAEQALPRAA